MVVAAVLKNMEQNKKIFTIDVEEYYIAENIWGHLTERERRVLPARLPVGVNKLLDLLAGSGNKATFFVLGCLAEKNKTLIKRICEEGHEVASHGFSHRPLNRHTPTTFKKDLEKSIKVLSDVTGEKIIGYRAPSFSITEEMAWVFEVLKEKGILYDSSSCISLFRKHHHKVWRKVHKHGTGLLEVTPSYIDLGFMELPLGGGYFRAYPYLLTKWGMGMKHKMRRTPSLFYIHPWELDPDQPLIRMSPLKMFRHYLNLGSTEKKVKKLLSDFQFISIRDFLLPD